MGQRTTLDVLNAQQELVNARVALVTAQHDRVVASYTLLAAVGGLSMQHLGLNVQIYDPRCIISSARRLGRRAQPRRQMIEGNRRQTLLNLQTVQCNCVRSHICCLPVADDRQSEGLRPC